jgi:hypothetical protein
MRDGAPAFTAFARIVAGGDRAETEGIREWKTLAQILGVLAVMALVYYLRYVR